MLESLLTTTEVHHMIASCLLWLEVKGRDGGKGTRKDGGVMVEAEGVRDH